MGDGGGTIQNLEISIEALKTLRCNVALFYETIAFGPMGDIISSTEEREREFRTQLQTLMHKIFENIKDVDQIVSGLNSPSGPFQIGNTSHINQEVAKDKIPLYSQLTDCYKWIEKVQEFSSIALPLLSANPLKRSHLHASASAKRRRSIMANFIVQPQAVDNAINMTKSALKEMDIIIQRPLGSNAVLCITVGRTMQAVMTMKGLIIEWIVVRGMTEDMKKEDGSIDLWTESRHKVFQKVTDNAYAGMLHFFGQVHPDFSIRNFLIWFNSFNSLFTQPCKKCGLHLSNNLPPTWRDLRTMVPFHEECKP